jgi:hypothetical protein
VVPCRPTTAIPRARRQRSLIGARPHRVVQISRTQTLRLNNPSFGTRTLGVTIAATSAFCPVRGDPCVAMMRSTGWYRSVSFYVGAPPASCKDRHGTIRARSRDELAATAEGAKPAKRTLRTGPQLAEYSAKVRSGPRLFPDGCGHLRGRSGYRAVAVGQVTRDELERWLSRGGRSPV